MAKADIIPHRWREVPRLDYHGIEYNTGYLDGLRILDIFARVDQMLIENNPKPLYSNVRGLPFHSQGGVRVFLEKKNCTLIFEEKKNCTLIV